jgi:hypothetical protein
MTRVGNFPLLKLLFRADEEFLSLWLVGLIT